MTGHTGEHTYTHGTPTHTSPSSSSRSRNGFTIAAYKSLNSSNRRDLYIVPLKIKSSALLPNSDHSPPPANNPQLVCARLFRSRCHRQVLPALATRKLVYLLLLAPILYSSLEFATRGLRRVITVDGGKKRKARKIGAPRRVALCDAVSLQRKHPLTCAR